MKPAPFEYVAPRELPEALDVLSQRGSDAKILAGGQSLVPLMNFRLARPACLVDINNVDELAGITPGDSHVAIGATTRQYVLERDATVQRDLPLLAEAARLIGHPAIRNRGTVGGSLAHADPAAELPVVALALDAEMVAERRGGRRVMPADQFFQGYLATALEPDEALTQTLFPVPAAGTGWCFLEVARRHGDFALAAVAVLLRLRPDGRIASTGIALGGVGGRPVRAAAAEHALEGEQPGEAVFRTAGALAAVGLEAEDDLHASAAYRCHLVEVLVRRALIAAHARCGAVDRGGRD